MTLRILTSCLAFMLFSSFGFQSYDYPMPSEVSSENGLVTINIFDTPSSSPDDAPLLNFYPNPATDIVNIMPAEEVYLYQLDIRDEDGNLIFSEEVDGATTFEVNLEPGTYYFFGKVNWGLALTVAIGTLLLAGACE